MGYAGFRIHYPLNNPGDELGVFQGASYFRFLCRRAAYGLSARALAVNTAESGGEEFPSFREFWVERPATGRHADCDLRAAQRTERESGRLPLRGPSRATTPWCRSTRASIYCRKNPAVLGLAPLTSMFWHGKNTNVPTDDFRPEVHDSDGLMMNTGSGEWLWRPLTNPSSVRCRSMAFLGPESARLRPAAAGAPLRQLRGPRSALPIAPEHLDRTGRRLGLRLNSSDRTALA